MLIVLSVNLWLNEVKKKKIIEYYCFNLTFSMYYKPNKTSYEKSFTCAMQSSDFSGKNVVK